MIRFLSVICACFTVLATSVAVAQVGNQPIYTPPNRQSLPPQNNPNAAAQNNGLSGLPIQFAVNGQNVAPVQEQILPCPFPPLDNQHTQVIDRLLFDWEQQSNKIERYRCDFERWEYDPIMGPQDPKEAKTYAKGKIQYASPDKGLFKIETVKVNLPPTQPGQPRQWVDKSDSQLEHWVCDGIKIFEFNYPNKKLIERTLPPELHGKAIVDGPLPFLFGAKADKIKARYWLRLVTPTDIKGEFWLEAMPKYRRDAQNFKMVHVIIDQKDFLPKALQVFDPSYDAQKRQIRTVFTFNQRDVNFSQGLQFFLGQFYQPKTPLGWKFVSEPYYPEPGQAAPAANNNVPATATRPAKSALDLIPFRAQPK
jgi:TIGR03009 family protein